MHDAGKFVYVFYTPIHPTFQFSYTKIMKPMHALKNISETTTTGVDQIGVLNCCTNLATAFRQDDVDKVVIISVVHVAKVGVMYTQTGHSYSSLECCTAGESLSLHYYTTEQDHHSFMRLFATLFYQNAFVWNSTLLSNLLLPQLTQGKNPNIITIVQLQVTHGVQTLCELEAKNRIPPGMLLWQQNFFSNVNGPSNHHTKFEAFLINN